MSELDTLRCVAVVLFCVVLAACQPSPDSSPSGAGSPVEKGSIALHGHQDLKKSDKRTGAGSRGFLPWYVGADSVLQWCVRAPVELDTSRWELSMYVGRSSSSDNATPFSSPLARNGSVMCFAGTVAEELGDGEHQVCAVLRDRQDVWKLPCLKFYFEKHNNALHALSEQRASLLATSSTTDIIAPMVELASRASQAGFPMFATSAELIAAHFLKQRGDVGDLQEVARLLDRPREWLQSSSAHGIAGQLHYQRAVTLLEQNERNKAWTEMRFAEERYRQVAHPQFIVAVTRRAEILMQAGAAQEAQEKLNRAILDCRSGRCAEDLLRNAKNAMAWWLIQAPFVSADQTQRADKLLAEAIVGTKGVERSNVLVNQAYSLVVAGGDPRQKLTQANKLLASHQSARVDSLSRWSEFVLALYWLQQSEHQAFLTITQELIESNQRDYLQARVRTVRGQYFRANRYYGLARQELEKAVRVYQDLSQFNQRVLLNPGQQALAFFELAGVAVDEHDAALAWRWLDQLEASLAPSACQTSASLKQSKRAAELTSKLAELDVPASLARKAQRDTIRFQLQDELQELSRFRVACAPDAGGVSAIGQFRGFVSSGEVILLKRNSVSEVQVEKRTKVNRSEFVGRIEELNRRMHAGALEYTGTARVTARGLDSDGSPELPAEPSRSLENSDQTSQLLSLPESNKVSDPSPYAFPALSNSSWRDVALPLAEALLPADSSELGSATYYVLHDVLQRIPIQALPYKDGWFSDATTAVMSIKRRQAPVAGVVATPLPSHFLFVVDPLNNLPGSKEAVNHYRRLFPQAVYLNGAQATTVSAMRAMRHARVWHFDSHARFDSAFPELSPLVLADGELTAGQLTQVGGPLFLVNLSGCQTGAWPVTATHGQFGMAGALAQSKSEWVIASGVPLKNSMAVEFNTLFYRSIVSTSSVSEAYSFALGELKHTYPVSRWASLLLIGHFEGADRPATDSL